MVEANRSNGISRIRNQKNRFIAHSPWLPPHAYEILSGPLQIQQLSEQHTNVALQKRYKETTNGLALWVAMAKKHSLAESRKA
jgi:hypothetical protein